MDSAPRIAWVESPLQFVSAAEHAARSGRKVRVAFRFGTQMPETAAELLRRDAPFASCVPYVGIPWRELTAASEWVVGDGLSGQFQLAAAVLRPRAVTLLDDGDMSLRLAAGLSGDVPFARTDAPGKRRALIAGLAREHLLGLAGGGRLRFSSVYGAERRAFARLQSLGVELERNRFEWLRAGTGAAPLPSRRVVLGTAKTADGLVPLEEHLERVGRVAADSMVAYLPHRREPAEHRAAVAALPGVEVIDRGLPVELVLAGMRDLDIRTPGSSADDTLALVLAGSGSRIRRLDRSEVLRRA